MEAALGDIVEDGLDGNKVLLDVTMTSINGNTVTGQGANRRGRELEGAGGTEAEFEVTIKVTKECVGAANCGDNTAIGDTDEDVGQSGGFPSTNLFLPKNSPRAPISHPSRFLFQFWRLSPQASATHSKSRARRVSRTP